MAVIEPLTDQNGILRDEMCDLGNQLDRAERTVKAIDGLNKTLAVMFHTGKGKRLKGRGSWQY
jgi:hypothetical protein